MYYKYSGRINADGNHDKTKYIGAPLGYALFLCQIYSVLHQKVYYESCTYRFSKGVDAM